MRRAIARVGAPNGVRFTARQLYYEWCRTLLPLHRVSRRVPFTLPAPVSYRRFADALAQRTVPGLLPPPAPQPAQDKTEPPDLYDYGLPRLLVCQDASIAHMLRANDLHMESACPVFAVDDLPPDPRIDAALHLGAGTVYVLHDASAAGLTAVERVAAAFGSVRPIGLRPVHAASLHLFRQPGGDVEVAAVNPARLLRTVHRLVRDRARTRPTVPLRAVRDRGFLTWPEG